MKTRIPREYQPIRDRRARRRKRGLQSGMTIAEILVRKGLLPRSLFTKKRTRYRQGEYRRALWMLPRRDWREKAIELYGKP